MRTVGNGLDVQGATRFRGGVLLDETAAAQTNPSSGQLKVFAKATSGLWWRNSGGTERQLATINDVTSSMTTHTGATDPHPQYLTQTEGDARYQLAGGGSGTQYTRLSADSAAVQEESTVITTPTLAAGTYKFKARVYYLPSAFDPDYQVRTRVYGPLEDAVLYSMKKLELDSLEHISTFTSWGAGWLVSIDSDVDTLYTEFEGIAEGISSGPIYCTITTNDPGFTVTVLKNSWIEVTPVS